MSTTGRLVDGPAWPEFVDERPCGQPALVSDQAAARLAPSGFDQAQGRVIRVQDARGRGPYRPGFSRVWRDLSWPAQAPWWEEIGEDPFTAHLRIDGAYHCGCAFRTQEQLRRWFSPRELRALDRHGFALASIVPDVVFIETASQVVIGTLAPLSSACRVKLTSKQAEAA